MFPTRFFVLVTTLLLVFAGAIGPSAAQPDDNGNSVETDCWRAEMLQVRIRELEGMDAALARDGLTDAHARRFFGWANGFRREVGDPNSFGDQAEGAVLGVLADLTAEGGVGWASGGTGAGLTVIYNLAKQPVNLAGSWNNTDQNTAFWQWLLDYVEHGRTSAVDEHLLDFAREHAGVLRDATGHAPPVGGSNETAEISALGGWMAQNAMTLFYQFGRYEELAGARAFPRWKANVAGKDGQPRYGTGYYRAVLVDRVRADIQKLRGEVAALVEKVRCRGLEDCGSVDSVAEGQSVTCACTSEAANAVESSVWGTLTYTSDSTVCRAARHAGAIGHDGGVVTLKRTAACPGYTGSTRNEVQTSDWGSFRGSFYFPRYSKGVCDEAYVIPAGAQLCTGSYGVAAPSIDCWCRPVDTRGGIVWGSNPYTSDSSICRAALHAGRIGPNGGRVRVFRREGRESYQGSTLNGVSSNDWGAYGSSFVIP